MKKLLLDLLPSLAAVGIILIPLSLIFLPWIVNAYKLSQCDFEAPYKCEVLHGAGIVPVVSFVTVWFGTDQ